MSVRGTLGGVFAAAAVVIIGWQVGTAASATSPVAGGITTSGGTTSGTSGTSGTTGTGSANGTGSASGTPTTTASGLKDGTYTGDSEQTQFGNVQVKVRVSGGKITDVTAIELTDREFRSVQISNQAAPILRQEVLAAQSAQVDYVSGATYTSDGYLTSVQSALDQAS